MRITEWNQQWRRLRLALFLAVTVVFWVLPVQVVKAEEEYSDLPGGVSVTGKVGFLERKSRQETETEAKPSSGNHDDNSAHEPPPKTDLVDHLGDYPVTKVESPLILTDRYEDSRFSLYIPKGWAVETTGVYSSLVIRVYDPQVPERSVFLFCGIYPYLRSLEQRLWYEANQELLDEIHRPFKDAPVLGALTMTYFLTTLEDLREFCSKYYASGLTWNPDLIPDFGRYRVAEMWDSNIDFFEDCLDSSIIHLFYNSPLSGRSCSALLTAQITLGEAAYAGDMEIGFNSVYAFTGVTAPTEEIGQMMGTMIRHFSSLTFSEEFIAQARAYDEMRPEILAMMPDILISVEDQFNRKWDTRDISPEIEESRQSDEAQGLIRLIDTENKDIYLADKAFYEAYSANRFSYEKKNLYPISEVDEQYYVWAVKYRVGQP